jgi:hypothetical protein
MVIEGETGYGRDPICPSCDPAHGRPSGHGRARVLSVYLRHFVCLSCHVILAIVATFRLGRFARKWRIRDGRTRGKQGAGRPRGLGAAGAGPIPHVRAASCSPLLTAGPPPCPLARCHPPQPGPQGRGPPEGARGNVQEHAACPRRRHAPREGRSEREGHPTPHPTHPPREGRSERGRCSMHRRNCSTDFTRPLKKHEQLCSLQTIRCSTL